MLKKISVGELQPDETVGAVREARLLAKVKIECCLLTSLAGQTLSGEGEGLASETTFLTTVQFTDKIFTPNIFPQLHHPSIVKFHDSFLEKDYFCIVTELCEVRPSYHMYMHVYNMYIPSFSYNCRAVT